MKEQKNQPEDMIQDKGERRHRNIMMVYLILYDAIAINFSYFFGLLLRFDFKFSSIPPEYFQAFFEIYPILYGDHDRDFLHAAVI